MYEKHFWLTIFRCSIHYSCEVDILLRNGGLKDETLHGYTMGIPDTMRIPRDDLTPRLFK